MLRDAPRRVELRLVAAGAALAVELARTAAGHRLLTRTYLRSPYLDIDGDWDAFLRARTSRYRSNYRRGLKQLEAQGAVELALAEGEAGVARFGEALAVEASGWKGADGTAIVSSPETHAFYSKIVVWAAERGALRLVSLDVDGRMLAFVFGVREGTTFFELKTGFDNAHAHARPGAVLHHLLLARLFREGLARYEFLGRDDPWKLWLASGTHERVLLQVFAPGAAGLADWAAFRYGRPVVKRLLTTATSFRGRRR
jgi:CelD/BcsL family acetyltransferase involved in cellulose biosynthesis